MTVRDEAIAALTDDWVGALEVWKKVGCWGPRSVRAQLNLAFAAGAVERRAVPNPPWETKYEYRRKGEA